MADTTAAATSNGAPPQARRRVPVQEGRRGSSPSLSKDGSEIEVDDNPHNSKLYTILDLLRPFLLLPIILPLLSYLTTSPTSYTFNIPNPLPNRHRLLARLQGPLHLTDVQLSAYNGTDPALPILLGLNGEIYDVTASPHIYGPGGSYHFFAGRDGSRGFVTGCWDVGKGEVTGDLRGVEEMFLPAEDEEDGDNDDKTEAVRKKEESSHRPAPEAIHGDDSSSNTNEANTKAARRDRKLRRERERRQARKKVHETLDGWRKMFDGGKGGKYFWRGTIQRGAGTGWPGWGEAPPPLCESASHGRPRRTADQV